MENEPQLEIALGNWKDCWNRFEKVRSHLAEQAKSLFKQKKLSREVAETLGTSVAREGMRISLLGEEPYLSEVEDTDTGRFHLIRNNRKTSEEVYHGTKQQVEVAKNAYEFVLSQISHEGRMEPVKAAYSSLVVSAQAVEDFVERLVLIGRPQGQCSLCPGRPQLMSLPEIRQVIHNR
jgi:hypothetical protein